jgi:hypothetical protein
MADTFIKTSPRRRFYLIIKGLIVSGVALLQVTHFVGEIYLNYAFKNLPATEAIITLSKVENLGRCSHHPAITYEYNVAGHHYVNSNYSYNEAICEEPRADETISRYPVGTKLNIHYNPDKPAQSVLVAGHVSAATWMFTIIFSSIAIWCLFSTYFVFKKTSNNKLAAETN